MLITWEKLDISCSIANDQKYFFGDAIELIFSVAPDKKQAEDLIKLYLDNKILTAKYSWMGNSLFIQPMTSWQKGQAYRLSIEGSLRMENGSSYNLTFYRAFRYGEPGVDFCMLSHDFINNALIFNFSKAVSISSFNDNFSISPYLNYNTDFSEDKHSITLTPKSKWQTNTVYKWIIKDLKSNDGYIMNKEYTGVVIGHVDTESPRLLTVCPVDYSQKNSIWYDDLVLNNNLFEWQAIGFIFSKPMDESSIIAGISFQPAMSGEFLKEESDRFIFIPAINFEIQKEYRLIVANTVMDTSDMYLFEDEVIFFKSANSFLEIESILFDDEENSAPLDGSIYEYPLSSSGKLNTIINFSSLIPQENRYDAVNAISFNTLFPLEASNPSLVSAIWGEGTCNLCLSWEGFSKSTQGVPKYYKLVLKGGKSGIRNGAGEYLKEDVCVILKLAL